MLGQLTSFNPVLSAIKLTKNDKITSIKEIGVADSNFIITHLIKQILQNKEKLCFVTFHNTLNHYQNVGKKLGYDLMEEIKLGDVTVFDMLEKIDLKIAEGNYDFLEDESDFVEILFEDIQKRTIPLETAKHTYLIIDDISHLLDLNVNIGNVLRFITRCCNLENLQTSLIINNHVSNFSNENNDSIPKDVILSNYLSYISDLEIEVSPLKTGRSNEVTGVLNIKRKNIDNTLLHYKAYDRGIRTFKPGESIMNLLK